ncbi:response regulator [Chitinispirillales bacterium ANBcel5]|uniref:HDOD domain-containing protein n=1 Tax=Cellulosispirillum alkaliphilum TaxID=3039283 RepID=UPI002A4EE8B2|nr:response regulator [Chitinispirillales bacterium ANBcel5]
MNEKRVPGVLGGSNDGPLVLLFSCREKVREILSVGLVQCNYRVIQASTSFLATFKATQILPDLVVADLAEGNPADIILTRRLRKSQRTQDIAILVILPKNPHQFIIQCIAELEHENLLFPQKRICTIGYPFSFSDFLESVKVLAPSDEPKDTATKNALPDTNRGIAARIFDLSIPASQKLEEIDSLIHKQWAFPFTVVKAFEILESNKSCCGELGKCISSDPAVSSAVLKVVNTVFYAGRHGRINHIKDAVVRLGFRETRNIMACLTLINLTPGVHKLSGFERREFWLHSLAVALIAERLSVECKFRKPEYAFISGLLHDLGKIPIDNNFEDVFPRLLDETISCFGPFCRTEERLMGFTHAQLGHYLTTKWNLPSIITGAILNHHESDRILQSSSSEERLIQSSVFVANILAKAIGIGHSCDEVIEEVPTEITRALKLNVGPTERFIHAVFNEVKKFCQFMNLHFSRNLPVHENDKPHQVLVVYQDTRVFHPVVTALRSNGFDVKVTAKLPESKTDAKVIISIPQKGLPPEIMLYEDDLSDEESDKTLKIFLVPLDSEAKYNQDLNLSDMVFMKRNNLDLRILIHTLDTFFGKVGS